MRLSFGQELAAGSEAGACAADDPVDGDPAIADDGVARADRARDAGERGARIGRGGSRSAAKRRVETPNPDAPTPEERELVVDETKDNEADFERLLNMDEEWPDHFEERSRPSATRLAEEGDRQHDAMANMVDRPQSLHEYLHDQLSWFDLDEPLRQMCDRIIYSLDSNGYLQGRLEDLIDSDGGPAGSGAGTKGAGRDRAKARSAGHRRPRPAGMPAAATQAGHAATSSS